MDTSWNDPSTTLAVGPLTPALFWAQTLHLLMSLLESMDWHDPTDTTALVVHPSWLICGPNGIQCPVGHLFCRTVAPSSW